MGQIWNWHVMNSTIPLEWSDYDSDNEYYAAIVEERY